MFITREDEHNLPDFTSHDQARAYFKKRYGDKFQLEYSIELKGRKLYFYQLCCTQSIQIFEDGEIHIVY